MQMNVIFISNVDSLDWKDLSAEDISKRVTAKVKPGSIVLFHNAAKNTPTALPAILEKLQADGYTIVPVSQILIPGETTLDHEGRQHPAKAPAGFFFGSSLPPGQSAGSSQENTSGS